MANQIDNIVMENAKILFRNFSGERTKYNRAGNRNFSVLIEDLDLATKLMNDGWNVKPLKQRDEDDDLRYHLPISVTYDYFPPKVYIVTKKKKTLLNAETIDSLDYAEIKNVDLTIRPYEWEVEEKHGIKAYLKTMYVTIEEDEFADKYAAEESPE